MAASNALSQAVDSMSPLHSKRSVNKFVEFQSNSFDLYADKLLGCIRIYKPQIDGNLLIKSGN